MEKFYSNGKLLITGEYCVLDGAKAFALPTRFGQSLEVCPLDKPVIIWESFSVLKELWFQAELKTNELDVPNENPMIATLQKILLEAQKMNPKFLGEENGAFVQTFLSFPNEWGLGTSSTLINNIASWAKVDAFQLLQKSFGGSGYDIACAQNNAPIYYTRGNQSPIVSPVKFDPSFKENLFFVYLNKKQNSKDGIESYRSLKKDKEKVIEKISKISEKITSSKTLEEFENYIELHEILISDLLEIPTVKENLFSDYFGKVKSLGAWGGDFVLVTGNENTPEYFEKKGYDIVLDFQGMILNN